MTEVVERLPSKCETLSSNPRTTKKQTERQKERKWKREEEDEKLMREVGRYKKDMLKKSYSWFLFIHWRFYNTGDREPIHEDKDKWDRIDKWVGLQGIEEHQGEERLWLKRLDRILVEGSTGAKIKGRIWGNWADYQGWRSFAKLTQ
jgi:hypothetical protein